MLADMSKVQDEREAEGTRGDGSVLQDGRGAARAYSQGWAGLPGVSLLWNSVSPSHPSMVCQVEGSGCLHSAGLEESPEQLCSRRDVNHTLLWLPASCNTFLLRRLSFLRVTRKVLGLGVDMSSGKNATSRLRPPELLLER